MTIKDIMMLEYIGGGWIVVRPTRLDEMDEKASTRIHMEKVLFHIHICAVPQRMFKDIRFCDTKRL